VYGPALAGGGRLVAGRLRLGGAGFLQLLAISPTKDWTQAFSRFRAVRDSIDPR